MNIIVSDTPILKCTAFNLIVPCSRYGTIVSADISSNYKTTASNFSSIQLYNPNSMGDVLKSSEYGYPNNNYLSLIGIIVLNYAHDKCNEDTLKYFERSLYNLSKSSEFQYRKENLGMHSLDEWVEEKYIPLCFDMLEKYLGKNVVNLTMYK